MKHSPTLYSALLIVAFHWLATASPAQAERHLFLDPSFIQNAQRASLHVNPPQQRELVIPHDKPWEKLMITFFLTVREEQGKLRMWYTCRESPTQANVAYAESTDGTHWTKPNLGIVEYAGSKDNNLVGLRDLEGVVFADPNMPASQRYAYVTHIFGKGIFHFHSPDGLHWTRDAEALMKLGADTQNVTFWDHDLQKYVLYLRGWSLGPDKKRYRKVLRAEAASLTTPLDVGPSEKSAYIWGKDKPPIMDEEFPTVFAADEHDPPNTDVYNLSAQPYPLDPHWFVAFPSFFRRERTNSQGKLEVQFAGSRDGIAWHRYDRAPYAPLGLAGSETENMTFMGTGMVVRGDEIWQYGTGYWSKHGDFEPRKTRTDGAIYRYVQRLDGFVSLDFTDEAGECRTAPVKVEGAHLMLNVDTGALGQFRVGLVDADGKDISGYSADDCELVRTNSTHAVVSWTGGGDLTKLVGRDVRLKLSGSRAKLYSFYFVDGAP
jgi:hypothetical protein